MKVLALDESLSQAHASLALVHFRLDWNWALAEAALRRALALSPRDADVHHAFAFDLIAMERRAEALAEATEAHRLQPLSPIIGTGLGRILHFVGHNDRALEQFQRVQDLEASFAQAHFDLSFALADQGRLDEALESCRTAIALSPGGPCAPRCSPTTWPAGAATREAKTGREGSIRADLGAGAPRPRRLRESPKATSFDVPPFVRSSGGSRRTQGRRPNAHLPFVATQGPLA